MPVRMAGDVGTIVYYDFGNKEYKLSGESKCCSFETGLSPSFVRIMQTTPRNDSSHPLNVPEKLRNMVLLLI